MTRLAALMTLGLVASACSGVHLQTPPGASSGGAAPPAASVRLCSWNVRKLGHGAHKNYPLLADVIDTECDAAVLLEVMQRGRAYPGYDALRSALGPQWTGTTTDSPRPNTPRGNSEFYAVVWRVGAMEQCSGWHGLRYVIDNDGSASGAGIDRFSREPAYGCFRMARPAGEFDFLLAAYHAVWGRGSAGAIQREVANIDGVLAEMKAARPGEKDLLFLGDFNLGPRRLARVTTLADWTTGAGSTLNSSGAITRNLYDHLLVDSPSSTPELGNKAVVLDVTHRTTSGAVFYRTLSDHLPLRVVVTPSGPDDD